MKGVIIFVTLLILIIIGIIITYLHLTNKKERPVLLNEIVKGNIFNVDEKCRMITEEEMPDGISLPDVKGISIPELKESKKLTLNLWVKPENQTDNFLSTNDSFQNILEWSDNLSISYEPMRNELIIKIKAYVSSDINIQEFRIPNSLGIQKWNMVTLTIDNRYMDVYINGKLNKTILLMNVPVLEDSSDWTLFKKKGFFGKVTAIRYFNYTLNNKEVTRLYNGTKGNPPKNRFWWLWIKFNSLNVIL